MTAGKIQKWSEKTESINENKENGKILVGRQGLKIIRLYVFALFFLHSALKWEATF